MATNSVGKGTKTCGVNMKMPMWKEIKRRADSMQLSMGAYIKIILQRWLDSGDKLELVEK